MWDFWYAQSKKKVPKGGDPKKRGETPYKIRDIVGPGVFHGNQAKVGVFPNNAFKQKKMIF